MTTAAPFLIEIRHVPSRARLWQRRIVESLAATPGISLRLVECPPSAPDPAGLDLLFAFDRLFVGRDEETAVDRSSLAARACVDGPADLVIDLDGGLDRAADAPLLVPSCLGVPPLDGALAALLDERVPVLELDLIEASGARCLGRWPVAIEDRRNSLRAASMVMGRLAHMVVCAVDRLRRRPAEDAALSIADAVGSARFGRFGALPLFLRSLEARIRRKLDRLSRTRVDWATVWRRRDPTTSPYRPWDDATPFRLLADDGARFFADPFAFDVGDRTLLFLEEFPYATGRGILSVAEIDASGRVSAPRPILEESCHLSYPQVFAHAGSMWMIPETSGRRTVELWRADVFPDRWTKHAVLLADVDLADATVEEIDGTWWMFGTSRAEWCSSWDALHVYRAPALEGPWTALDPAPIRVDVASARPGGRLFRDGDRWMRPVQDSSTGYGCGLALARIDRLDAGGLDETVVARLATPAPLAGLHTWNRSSGASGLFETFDVFVDRAAFGAERRLDLTPRAGAAQGVGRGDFES